MEQILQELNAVYDPQRRSYTEQIGTLDPQLQAETQGLEAQKQDSFQQITNQANRRGLFYSGLPIAEEQRYTGQQFLPAVANLRAKYASQRFGLQDAIAKITADQYNQAYGVRQKELETEEEARQFNERLAAQERASAAARASAGGGGVGGMSGIAAMIDSMLNGGGSRTAPEAPDKDKQTAAMFLQDVNPYRVYDFLRKTNDAVFGGKASYGQLAAWAEDKLGGRIGTGTAADLALRALYLGTNLESGQGNQGVPGSPNFMRAATPTGQTIITPRY